jgi:hypothetical protein
MLAYSYWRRIWVLQETALSENTVAHCGNYQFDFWDAVSTLSRVFRHGYAFPDLFLQTGPFSKSWILNPFRHARHNARFPSTDILEYIADSHSSEPRDRLYGVLALLPSDFKVDPDYTLSIKEVFILATSATIWHDGTLDILRLAGVWDSSRKWPGLPNLPSWTLDLGLRRYTVKPLSNADACLKSIVSGEYGYRAGARYWRRDSWPPPDTEGTIPFTLTLTDEKVGKLQMKRSKGAALSGELIIHAMMIDELIGLHSLDLPVGYFSTTPTAERNEFLRRTIKDFREIYHSWSGLSGSASSALVFWKTMTMDVRSLETVSETGWTDVDTPFASTLDDWLNGNEIQLNEVHTFLGTQFDPQDHISTFRTKNGRFGCTFAFIQNDDVIALALRASYPLILRPFPGKRRNLYQLVGMCYIDGRSLILH